MGSDETLLHAGGEGSYVDGGERMLLDFKLLVFIGNQSPMKFLDFPTPRVLQGERHEVPGVLTL